MGTRFAEMFRKLLTLTAHGVDCSSIAIEVWLLMSEKFFSFLTVESSLFGGKSGADIFKVGNVKKIFFLQCDLVKCLLHSIMLHPRPYLVPNQSLSFVYRYRTGAIKIVTEM